MDGLRETVYALRVLVNCNRLTAYERATIKYALVIVEDYWREIEQTFYERGVDNLR